MKKILFDNILDINSINPYTDYAINEYLDIIEQKIKENEKLTKEEKQFLWSHTNKYTPKAKWELINILDIALSDYFHNFINNKVTDLNYINTSNITDMSNLFYQYKFISLIDINDWDVSNVTNMERMFLTCDLFDGDLSNWDVSNVTNMNCMFQECDKFTGKGLEKWDTSNCKSMIHMFCRCYKFNSDLSNWNVSNVTDMTGMFTDCERFKSNLKNWNVSHIKKMYRIFYKCRNLISDLSNWNISNVKDITNKDEFEDAFAQNIHGIKNIFITPPKFNLYGLKIWFNNKTIKRDM